MTAALTSSPRTVRVGAPRPRVLSVPPYVRTLGPECADFMADVGRPGLGWQRDALNPAFGIRADGKWAAYEVAIWLSRQNGKGWLTEAQELFGAYMLREKQIIHSAHLFDTSQKAFNRTIEIVENSDWLRKRTAKITRGKGFEAIHLLPQFGGGAIEFKARTLHGARGLTGDRVTLDEAYALTVGHYQAMSPVMATLPNPQITYTSSPPDETTGMMPADALAPSIRARGLAGDPALAMLSWEPPEDFDPGDVDVWYDCNPSLGNEEAIARGLALIDEEFLHRQWRVFQSSPRPMAYAVEHLGLWPAIGGAQWAVFPRQAWNDAEAQFDPPESVALVVTLSADRRWASICAAGAIGGGRYGVAILDRREGTGWVTERLFERARKLKPVAVLINRNGPANSLWAEVEEANLAELGIPEGTVIELVPVSPRDVAAACGALWDGICGQPSQDPDTGVTSDPKVVRHLGQPELTAAAAGAARKVSSSGSWVFDPAVGEPSSLEGAAVALFGYRTREPAVMDPWAFSV